MSHHGEDVSIEAMIPTRGLIGFETDLVTQTNGLGVMKPSVPRIRAGPRGHRGAEERLAGEHGKRRSDGIRAEHGAGTRHFDGGTGR